MTYGVIVEFVFIFKVNYFSIYSTSVDKKWGIFEYNSFIDMFEIGFKEYIKLFNSNLEPDSKSFIIPIKQITERGVILYFPNKSSEK